MFFSSLATQAEIILFEILIVLTVLQIAFWETIFYEAKIEKIEEAIDKNKNINKYE